MSRCANCGLAFTCAMVDGPTGKTCWCVGMPPLPPEKLVRLADGTLQSCVCPACLVLRQKMDQS